MLLISISLRAALQVVNINETDHVVLRLGPVSKSTVQILLASQQTTLSFDGVSVVVLRDLRLHSYLTALFAVVRIL